MTMLLVKRLVRRKAVVVGVGLLTLSLIIIWKASFLSAPWIFSLERDKQQMRPEGILGEPMRRNRKLLIIVAYFRSGSSFVSEIFNRHDGSFFIFEPLFYFFTNTGYVTNLNGTKRSFNTTEERISHSLTEIQNWLECNLEEICYEALADKDFMGRGVSSQSFRQCVGVQSTLQLVRKCLHHLKEACELSTLRVIKTIRLDVKVFETMLKQNANLQLLHLVRDPRGILYSRKNVKSITQFSIYIRENADQLCFQMDADLNTTAVFQKRFPNRVRIVRYENVAMNPISEARHLYEYIGVTPFFEDLARVYCKSFSDTNMEDNYKTERVNSSLVSYRWFKSAKKQDVRKIDRACGDVYQKLGYFSLNSEQHLSSGSLFQKKSTIKL